MKTKNQLTNRLRYLDKFVLINGADVLGQSIDEYKVKKEIEQLKFELKHYVKPTKRKANKNSDRKNG